MIFIQKKKIDTNILKRLECYNYVRRSIYMKKNVRPSIIYHQVIYFSPFLDDFAFNLCDYNIKNLPYLVYFSYIIMYLVIYYSAKKNPFIKSNYPT